MVNVWWRDANKIDPDYRPLLFHSEGENVGEQQEFPAPNNMNRKMRSVANIQRVGLFNPADKSGVSTTRTRF